MIQIIVYSIYLLTCFLITIYVGKNLHKNGLFLIQDLFQNHEFARTVNNFLLIGYYLINMGYVAITINSFGQVETLLEAFSELSYRTGVILLLLGIMHINNISSLHLLSTRKEKIIQLFNH